MSPGAQLELFSRVGSRWGQESGLLPSKNAVFEGTARSPSLAREGAYKHREEKSLGGKQGRASLPTGAFEAEAGSS